MLMRICGVAFVAAVVACGAPAITCGEPAPLIQNPTGVTVPGVRVGPIFVATGEWRDAPDATILWAGPGHPVKVLIQTLERIEHSLVVEGRRCDDGRPLRFAKDGLPWVGPPRSPPPVDVIERLTQTRLDITATLPYLADEYVQTLDGGYFIFTAPGSWRVEVRDGDHLIGTFVLLARDGRH